MERNNRSFIEDPLRVFDSFVHTLDQRLYGFVLFVSVVSFICMTAFLVDLAFLPELIISLLLVISFARKLVEYLHHLLYIHVYIWGLTTVA